MGNKSNKKKKIYLNHSDSFNNTSPNFSELNLGNNENQLNYSFNSFSTEPDNFK